jgi:hypothetical protein
MMGGMVVDTAGLPVERWDDVRRGTVTWQTALGAPTTPISGMTVGVAELAPDGPVDSMADVHYEFAAEVG